MIRRILLAVLAIGLVQVATPLAAQAYALGDSPGTESLGLAEPDNDWVGIAWILGGAGVVGVLILLLVTGVKHR